MRFFSSFFKAIRYGKVENNFYFTQREATSYLPQILFSLSVSSEIIKKVKNKIIDQNDLELLEAWSL